MQHLGNDMDDLFQRAAENYPLEQGPGGWEDIAKRIADVSKDTKPVAPPANNKNKNKKLIALAVLFFLSGSWFIFQNLKTKLSSRPNGLELTKKSDKRLHEAGIKNSNSGISNDERAFTNFSQKNKSANYNKGMIIYPGKNSSKVTKGIRNAFYFENSNETSNEKDFNNDLIIKKRDNYNNHFPGNSDDTTGETSEPGKEDNRDPAGISLANQGDEEHNSTMIKNKEKETRFVLQKKKGLYAGLAGGIDFSKVESGSFNNTGFDAGLVIGFRVSPNLSVETGIIWNKKNYVSDGRNFNMAKVRSTMPAPMVIDNLESHSSISEIPIKVRYDFINKRNGFFFASGGISAYMMTKEKNMYNVTMNGSQEKMTGVYNENDYELPAVANISIGYEHSLSKDLEIRIEPFLKIPLRGIGVGNLPVTSAGLQVVITGQLK
jgi:hypothetical protein